VAWPQFHIKARLPINAASAKSIAAMQMARRPYPLSKVYGLLEPGPVVLLITAHQGKANVMPMSWHTMLKFEPPLVSCVVSGCDFSFAALKATRHCVLNIPTAKC
jgi:flavin reductase (DIM6/NTAB) family NADH-FMN oxidoreductase RutF